ncbi:hypothetical protein Pmar_PMAR007377 [Perkinsus marinus ATCC 50983]|uniref:Uncharacterized protein n=1 Tax=Perkinsus marinus (strain ATCC 50983 / TXsc) TaxID=423536 RepID=C5K662_PERM5|nr:hypothetical protein Pmar_PMAR007377 [Perkinsus marinus ATCC 50983]EER20092.1 hypothetical protein Pmar_PMAR007377 [Perkinsus marinus ATCC 50983]|eukprot:XP_002788296.1 hypothetical protein Pmar_PMAR007377 [Perkinsus marinus ATCC 50983]
MSHLPGDQNAQADVLSRLAEAWKISKSIILDGRPVSVSLLGESDPPDNQGSMPDDDNELIRVLYALPYRRDDLPRSSQVISAAIGKPYRQELLQIQRDSPKASGLIAQLETSGVDHKDCQLGEDGVLWHDPSQ